MPTQIASIAAQQRAVNARRITATLAWLCAAATPVTFLLGAGIEVVIILALSTVGQAVAYALVRSGKPVVGVLISSLSLLSEHVGVVAAVGALGPVPYVSPLVILLVAATAKSRWLGPSFALTLLALAVEALLSPLDRDSQAAIFTACLFAVCVFVVSLLHVRGTERAFAIAQKRDTERAKAARAAKESERLYRLIANNSDDLIALVSAAGKALYLSPSHAVLEVDVQSMIGRRPTEFLAFENVEGAVAEFQKTLEHGEGQIELSLRTHTGELKRLDTLLKRIEADGEVLVVLISRDVTERKLLEQRLIASERLEALGRLAGSIAHDFNNLLTVIGGATDLAMGKLSNQLSVGRELEAVLTATSTATRLTRQLLTFSRKQLTVPVALDLKEALMTQRGILERLVGPNIEFDYQFTEASPRVVMPESHFEQLAMNLAVNARDAMPDGGHLTLKLRSVALEAREADGLAPGDYAEFSVSDTGTGVSQEVLPHLFDPFFTTKGDSGTGLGLATCQSVVSELGGAIFVETSKGRGTTFRVLLPIRTPEPVHARATQPTKLPVRQVLVVDDEGAVRETTARMLLASGFQVRTAATLDEATSIIEDSTQNLDALVTDVVLSGGHGTQLLERWRRLRPGTRVVVMSGYVPDPDASRALAADGATFLPKPFGREQLLKALQ